MSRQKNWVFWGLRESRFCDIRDAMDSLPRLRSQTYNLNGSSVIRATMADKHLNDFSCPQTTAGSEKLPNTILQISHHTKSCLNVIVMAMSK